MSKEFFEKNPSITLHNLFESHEYSVIQDYSPEGIIQAPEGSALETITCSTPASAEALALLLNKYNPKPCCKNDGIVIVIDADQQKNVFTLFFKTEFNSQEIEKQYHEFEKNLSATNQLK